MQTIITLLIIPAIFSRIVITAIQLQNQNPNNKNLPKNTIILNKYQNQYLNQYFSKINKKLQQTTLKATYFFNKMKTQLINNSQEANQARRIFQSKPSKT